MHELVILKSIVVILAISAIVVFLLQRIKVPSIVGFLLAGMLIGPYETYLIGDASIIQTLAEIGIILLLFSIGMEFSLSRFFKMRLEVFGIGGLYVLSSVAATAVISYQWLGDITTSIFAGFLVALSSTAIVMKLLADRTELDSPHGRKTVGILIFQDLCIVPFMLFIPVMSVGGGFSDIAITFGKALGIIALVLLSARWVVPFILHQIVRTRSRELFVITILIICFGIAFLTSEFGLSLALGAFLAGLIISESEYATEATSTILPLRDSFNGLFFVSIGMLMDMPFFFQNILYVISFVFGIMFLKFFAGLISLYIMSRSVRTSIQSSMNLAQVGEFSFVLSVAGLSAGLITNEMYQWFLSASVLTMILTPFIMQSSPIVSTTISSRKLLLRFERIKELHGKDATAEKRGDHIIIIGFGLTGRNLAKVLREVDIPYIVLEMNIDTVREMKKQGEPIYYGDGTKIETLQHFGIKTARGIVIVISDPLSCRNIVRTARRLNPELFIITRTHYNAEVDDLLNLGADEVIPEEFEASVEIFSRVLSKYQIPRNEIFNLADMIREDGYKALRQKKRSKRKPLFDKHAALSGISVEACRIKDNSSLVDKSIEEVNFRTKTGATILAIERNNEIHANPDPKFTLKTGDIAFLTGTREDINRAIVFITEG